MKVLTKADIIGGKKNIKTVEFEELEGKLKLRPISDDEYHRVLEIITGEGVGTFNLNPVIEGGDINQEATMKTVKLDLDLAKIEQNSFKANCLAVSLSLTHDENKEKFTPEEVGDFPAGSVQIIAAKVYEISGVDDPKNMQNEMKNFR